MNDEIYTSFSLITVQIYLTEHGRTNYKKVIELVLNFFKIVREDWLRDGQLALFNECKKIARLSYDECYREPDPGEQVTNLSIRLHYT